MTNEAMQEQNTLTMEVKRKPKGTETEPTIVDQMRETRDTTGEQRTKGESVRRKQQIKVVLGKRTSESALRSAKRLVVGSAAKFCGQVAQGMLKTKVPCFWKPKSRGICQCFIIISKHQPLG